MLLELLRGEIVKVNLLFGTHQLLEDDATGRGEFGVDASRHDDDAALDATVFGC